LLSGLRFSADTQPRLPQQIISDQRHFSSQKIMQLPLMNILNASEVAQVLQLLRTAPTSEGWVNGLVTTGKQSAQVKNNEQMPEGGRITAQARDIVASALGKSSQFMAAALPRRIYPPNFNRYSGQTNAFGAHIDNGLRNVPGGNGFLRTDISCTLFLTEPTSYEGGELVIQSPAGEIAYKLTAGSLLLYPSNSVHRVNPVTRGERLACFFWVESMVASNEQRQLLYELDLSIMNLRERELRTNGQESSEAVRLAGTYHNLLRMWAQT
jgi:PKHD-type hydroxylase